MTSSTENEETMESPHTPKTPHEEIMFVLESNNDIVSEILKIIETEREGGRKLLRTLREMIKK